MLLQIHNLLAHLDCPETIEGFMHMYGNQQIYFLDGPITINNILGAYFVSENHRYLHRNWIYNNFEKFISPLIGPELKDRPQLTYVRVDYFDELPINIYALMLNFSAATSRPCTEMFRNISLYVEKTCGKQPTVMELYKKNPGIISLYHSIEPCTLPTWHNMPNKGKRARIEVLSDSAYAQLISFLVRYNIFTNKMPQPPAETVPLHSLVTPTAQNPERRPFSPLLYSKNRVLPNVLWMQPYGYAQDALNYTVALGYKIEQENIDGIAIP
ncbi:hypothetical protein QAD02_018162 [Eretmocerus hayati]|uniref:Uncharacterized protein n=1 Tax=Eretmocerus hayati TaxID=131215 RepID=A0ACC2PG18_9HYME|nr:hypothetical protein QAD02_018162 [Eretmocerus hayati]